MNTVLLTSGNAAPLRTVTATKAEDQTSVGPGKASNPGMHPAVASRGEYRHTNSSPFVKPQQTSGVPPLMPNLLSAPANHHQFEQQQPQLQRLLDNRPISKPRTELAASLLSEAFVQPPMTHLMSSQNPSTEDQVQQLLQLLVSTTSLIIHSTSPSCRLLLIFYWCLYHSDAGSTTESSFCEWVNDIHAKCK